MNDKELDVLRAEIDGLKQEVSRLTAKMESLKREIGNMSGWIGDLFDSFSSDLDYIWDCMFRNIW